MNDLDGEVEEDAVGTAEPGQLHGRRGGRVDVGEYVQDIVRVDDVHGGGLGAVKGAEGHGGKGKSGPLELLLLVEVVGVEGVVELVDFLELALRHFPLSPLSFFVGELLVVEVGVAQARSPLALSFLLVALLLGHLPQLLPHAAEEHIVEHVLDSFEIRTRIASLLIELQWSI